MSQSPHAQWLLQESHPAIDETRWQHITQLLGQLFKASAAALVQYQGGEACILTLRQTKNVGLVKGSVDNIDSLRSRLRTPGLPTDGLWQYGLIEFPLYWPGGIQFGAALLVCDAQPPNLESCQMLAGPMLELIQSELKVYRQARQIEQMSLQDETTQMLNSHGFNLMAPRQLNLSRRLGSHAGLVVMENGTQFEGSLAEDKLKALSQVVYDNLREADLAARLGNQIVLLAFVDSQANLDSLVSRLRKQFVRKLEDQRVLTGHSFFTPDSHLELGPMLADAQTELEQTRARLYPKPSEESSANAVHGSNETLEQQKADKPAETLASDEEKAEEVKVAEEKAEEGKAEAAFELPKANEADGAAGAEDAEEAGFATKSVSEIMAEAKSTDTAADEPVFTILHADAVNDNRDETSDAVGEKVTETQGAKPKGRARRGSNKAATSAATSASASATAPTTAASTKAAKVGRTSKPTHGSGKSSAEPSAQQKPAKTSRARRSKPQSPD